MKSINHLLSFALSVALVVNTSIPQITLANTDIPNVSSNEVSVVSPVPKDGETHVCYKPNPPSEYCESRKSDITGSTFTYPKLKWEEIDERSLTSKEITDLKKNLSETDGNGGGDDRLIGYGGDDVYWLGEDTGNDVIDEHTHNSGDSGDKIRVKKGIEVSSVRLTRDTHHLYVQIVDGDGEVTDSLKVENYYSDASAKVETVEFSDAAKTVWDADDFALARMRGGSRGENLRGLSSTNDVFDGDAGGDDGLYGYGGNDVYWLGRGTGNDTIYEHYHNTGDSGDKIKIEGVTAVGSIRLTRNGGNLVVQLLDAKGKATGDSLTVDSHYTYASAKIESIELGNKALRESQFQLLIDEIAAFNAGTSTDSSLSSIYDRHWTDISTSA